MTAPLDEKAVMCGGCGNTDPRKRCIGCHHEFHPTATATALPDGMEVKPWPLGGYAPGNYTCMCLTCKASFIGDKRAHQCWPCAANQAQSALAAMRVERDRNATEYETVLNSYAEENQRLHDRAEAAEQQARDRKEGLERIAAIKYPAADTHYALKATIDYARDQARLLLKEGGE